jgi:uncharacterized protein YyaL (SSP411 family)
MANRLIHSRSPYLKKSSHQPVDWYEWGDEAFEKAKREDKPILLSIGGVWCHWCHVMAHECFENEEIARIINENFIPIKVDRDERPDIDRRYQDFVYALNGSGGWPLTVFLTPDGKPFFGGTYFPPEDRWGKPGFKNLLLKIAKLWKEDRKRLLNYAQDILQLLKSQEKVDQKGQISEQLLEQGINYTLHLVDNTNGGIGSAPKFHHAKFWELLLYRHFFTKDKNLLTVVEFSLDAMAKGGVYDHLLGGFFRYSTDDRWMIPHFEKMLYDNAELLHLYSLAYQVIPKRLYKRVAIGIVEYYREEGVDPEGGFYASQDADIGILDEGGYYTFSTKDFEKVLSKDELEIANLYFGIAKKEKNEERGILFIRNTEEEISKQLNIPIENVEMVVESIKNKLLKYREDTREKPFIDKTIYANWNGLMLEGLSTYYKVFLDPWAKEVANKTANRLIDKLYKNGELYHAEGVKGFAEDYVFLAKGLLGLFEITQENKWLAISLDLMEKAIEKFWDKEKGGFFDSDKEGEGLLKLKKKSIVDSPIQSVNGVAPYLLLLLASLSNKTNFIDLAKGNLEAFATYIEYLPTASASYLISLYAFLKGIFKIETRDYYEESLRLFRPFKFVILGDIDGILICEGSSCQKLDTFDELIYFLNKSY